MVGLETKTAKDKSNIANNTTLEKLIQKNRDKILDIAEKHGACNVRIFGSVARGEADQDSDIDLLVDLGENLSPWFPVRFIQDLEALLDCKVDVVTEKGLKSRIREQVLSEAKPL
ncbi:MAG: nucleotidyltransferase family protein [Leptolyngbya sp.]|nr:nucleotidyltransferase family protein [Leptolyngbya sp.]